MTSLNIRLSCRHTTTISHNSHADVAYCRFHGYQDITYIWFEEWRVRCITCTYGAWCKDNESGANLRAVKHQRDRGEAHGCVVIRDDKLKPKTAAELRKIFDSSEAVTYDRDIFGNKIVAEGEDDPPPF